DLLQLASPLDAPARDRLLALWDDYENAASPEARAVKAMDKLEPFLTQLKQLDDLVKSFEPIDIEP
ncbi:HD domain-containing protein, partial [Achromobacter xylosoxidans]|uniref:HD domain-containing protein n=1 Tax=Alcaligenes xylosoxydans xylosoxydans TaxID=85698 RepID=UPI001F0D6BA0